MCKSENRLFSFFTGANKMSSGELRCHKPECLEMAVSRIQPSRQSSIHDICWKVNTIAERSRNYFVLIKKCPLKEFYHSSKTQISPSDEKKWLEENFNLILVTSFLSRFICCVPLHLPLSTTCQYSMTQSKRLFLFCKYIHELVQTLHWLTSWKWVKCSIRLSKTLPLLKL